MSRRRIAVALTSLMALAAPAVAQAAPPQRSTTDRLGDRRYVVAGDRAYAVGAEDGSFPAMGFHTRGEMGGVWAPPLKLARRPLVLRSTGQWLHPRRRASRAARASSALDGCRARAGCRVRRTEVVPDGERGPARRADACRSATARTVTVGVDAHSELLVGLPVGRDDARASSPSTAQGRREPMPHGALRFTEAGKGWTALVGRLRRPGRRTTSPGRTAARRTRPWSAGRRAPGRRPRRRAATTPPTARAPEAS